MPSRYFVPIRGIDPSRVKLEHVHAAFSRWFDLDPAEHASLDKPYTISPLTDLADSVGVEIATLNDEATRRLEAACSAGAPVRLGAQTHAVGRPAVLATATWNELATGLPDEAIWTLQFVTPTTFRSGNRSSPMPTMTVIMAALSRSWNLWSGLGKRTYDPEVDAALWISDLDLRSAPVRLAIRDPRGTARPIHLSGCLGTLTLRCDDPETALRLAPLIRLAAYAGVGSMRGKGLGVTRVHTGLWNETAHRSGQ